MKKRLIGWLSVILLILIWQIYANSIANTYILPSPLTVFHALVELLSSSLTYIIVLTTLLRLIIAFLLSFVLGVGFGVLAGNYSLLDDFLHPFVSTLRSIPIASIIVIVLILMGKSRSLYLITFLMLFPIIYEATKDGVIHIDKQIKQAVSLETNNILVMMTRIQLPLAFPSIKTAVIQSIGLGFKVIVMAEFIAQSSVGIGKELYYGSISINYAMVFAWTIIIIIIVMFVEKLVNYLKKTYDVKS